MRIHLLVATLSQIGWFSVYPYAVYLGKEGHHVVIQHGSEKFAMQCRMAKGLLDVAACREGLSIANLSLGWDIVLERMKEDTVDVDFE
jgi:hypothetical protein